MFKKPGSRESSLITKAEVHSIPTETTDERNVGEDDWKAAKVRHVFASLILWRVDEGTN